MELIPAARKTEIARLDDTIRHSRSEIAAAEASGSSMLKSLTLARSMKLLRELLPSTQLKQRNYLMQKSFLLTFEKTKTGWQGEFLVLSILSLKRYTAKKR